MIKKRLLSVNHLLLLLILGVKAEGRQLGEELKGIFLTVRIVNY